MATVQTTQSTINQAATLGKGPSGRASIEVDGQRVPLRSSQLEQSRDAAPLKGAELGNRRYRRGVRRT